MGCNNCPYLNIFNQMIWRCSSFILSQWEIVKYQKPKILPWDAMGMLWIKYNEKSAECNFLTYFLNDAWYETDPMVICGHYWKTLKLKICGRLTDTTRKTSWKRQSDFKQIWSYINERFWKRQSDFKQIWSYIRE